MMEETNSHGIDMEFNDVNSNGENVVAINLKLLHFFFLENC